MLALAEDMEGRGTRRLRVCKVSDIFNMVRLVQKDQNIFIVGRLFLHIFTVSFIVEKRTLSLIICIAIAKKEKHIQTSATVVF